MLATGAMASKYTVSLAFVVSLISVAVILFGLVHVNSDTFNARDYP